MLRPHCLSRLELVKVFNHSDFKTASRNDWRKFQADANRLFHNPKVNNFLQRHPDKLNIFYETNRLVRLALVDLDYDIIPSEWIDNHHSTAVIE